MGPILVKKILRRGSYFTKIAKTCKISHFEVEKAIERVLICENLKKQQQQQQQTNKQTNKQKDKPFSEGEKSEKCTSSPRYWYASIVQHWTIFAFQYCKLLDSTSTFLRM